MIRVCKHSVAPLSLSITGSYNGEDVLKQLHVDQSGKCYLCERKLVTDFQVEHLQSKSNFPQLSCEWSNLFLSCGYCNQKKLDLFDGVVDPARVDVEDAVRQFIDFGQRRCIFSSDSDLMACTIDLLNRIYNGTRKLRTIREEKFFEYVLSVVNDFQRVVKQYLDDPSQWNVELVREQLNIDQECLGFKYWIIKNDPTLCSVFANDIVWNKR